MKKTFKSLLAIAMTFVMMLSFSIPAFAAGTNTITIKNEVSGHTYEAYQVFTGDLSGAEGSYVLSNIVWGNGITDAGKTALVTHLGLAADATAAQVAEKLGKITSKSEEAKAAAEIIGKYMQNPTESTWSSANKNYTIDLDKVGYYLVKDKDTSTIDSFTSFLMEVVGPTTVTPKSGIPTVEKKVLEESYTVDDGYGKGYNDVADYDIGDSVPFKLIGTLPSNYDSYTSYTYTFHDTLSAGLTYNSDAKVLVDGTEITSGFTVTPNGQQLTINFDNLKGISSITKDSKITVEYTATLNENAVIGRDGNLNEVYLDYSNNPNPGGEGNKGKTPDDKVIVFTYTLGVTKVDGADSTVKLAGAQFKLFSDQELKNEIRLVSASTSTAGPNTYRVAKTGETGLDFIVSPTNGVISVQGLDDGTYYLQEIQAPTGYNKLDKAITLVITANTVNGQNWVSGNAADALPDSSLTVTADSVAGVGDAATGVASVTVANNQGSTLPSTGGIGTTIFYVVGGGLMVGAAILLITRRRIANKH